MVFWTFPLRLKYKPGWCTYQWLFWWVEEGPPRPSESPRKPEAYFSVKLNFKKNKPRDTEKSVTALTAKTSKYLQRGLVPLLQSNQNKESWASFTGNNSCLSNQNELSKQSGATQQPGCLLPSNTLSLSRWNFSNSVPSYGIIGMLETFQPHLPLKATGPSRPTYWPVFQALF